MWRTGNRQSRRLGGAGTDRHGCRSLGGKAYKQAYRLNCPLVVLNVSVSNTHIDHVMNIVGEEIGVYKYLALATAPEFRTPFKVPRGLLTTTSTGKRCGMSEFEIIR
ncbi:MAG: hypothetical protein AAGI92_07785 [Pseudomonadota bacterium]